MKTCAACDYAHNHANNLWCQRCKQKTFKLRPFEVQAKALLKGEIVVHDPVFIRV